MTITERQYTKPLLIAFLCVMNAGWMWLAVSLIWLNASRPTYTVESCVAATIKRGAP